MKSLRSIPRLALALSLGLLVLTASRTSAQTLITSVPYTITTSGQYLLADNLNNNTTGVPAITVNAPNVVLNLGGFYVAGPGDASVLSEQDSVIYVGNVANVTVKNGTVAGAAFGIFFTANSPATTSRNYMIDNVVVTRCYRSGVQFNSTTAPGSHVRNCTFSTIGNSTSAILVSPAAIYSLGSVRIENNNISDVTATSGGVSYGIYGGPDDFAIGNTIAKCRVGLSNVGKYASNFTLDVVIPYQGGVNAGGNN